MKYANNVSCSPGAEDCTADSAYFDEDAVSAVQKTGLPFSRPTPTLFTCCWTYPSRLNCTQGTGVSPIPKIITRWTGRLQAGDTEVCTSTVSPTPG